MTTTDEKPILPSDTAVDVDYSYNDIHQVEPRDIAEGKTAPEPPPKEETEEVEVEEVDLEKIQENAAKIALKQIEDKQKAEIEQKQAEEQKRIEIETKEAQEQERINSEYKDEKLQKIVDDFYTKNGRNPSWPEVAIEIREEERRLFVEQQRQSQEAEKAQQDQQAKQKADESTRINSFIDEEMDDLYTNNRLTKIQDPTNQSDPGVLERKEFFRQWGEVNRQRVAEGKPEIISASRVFHNYYKKPNVQPAGANAPIAGNRSSNTTPESKEETYSYQDLKKPWSLFGRGK